MGDGHNYITVEIEHATGEPIDIDALSDLLRDHDLKLRTVGPGAHMLLMPMLERLQRDLALADRLVANAIGESVD